MSGKREITAIAILLSINALFGLSDKTTKFIFPEFGQEVFEIVNFYLFAILIFTIIVIWLEVNGNIVSLPTIPNIWVVFLNFAIFFIPSYLFISWLFQGNVSNVGIFSMRNFVEQGIVASNENLIAFILLPTIFPLGTGVGNILKKPLVLIKLRDYILNFNPPTWNRHKYGLKAIGLITLLHAGTYSYQSPDISGFYLSLTVAFILFNILWWIKETFGFGSCVACHLSWNLVLLTIRGAVI